jgi:hypothetical protein
MCETTDLRLIKCWLFLLGAWKHSLKLKVIAENGMKYICKIWTRNERKDWRISQFQG